MEWFSQLSSSAASLHGSIESSCLAPSQHNVFPACISLAGIRPGRVLFAKLLSQCWSRLCTCSNCLYSICGSPLTCMSHPKQLEEELELQLMKRQGRGSNASPKKFLRLMKALTTVGTGHRFRRKQTKGSEEGLVKAPAETTSWELL